MRFESPQDLLSDIECVLLLFQMIGVSVTDHEEDRYYWKMSVVPGLLRNQGAVLPPFRVPHVFSCVRSLHVYRFCGTEAYLQGHDLHLGFDEYYDHYDDYFYRRDGGDHELLGEHDIAGGSGGGIPLSIVLIAEGEANASWFGFGYKFFREYPHIDTGLLFSDTRMLIRSEPTGIAVDTSLQETIRVEICRNDYDSTRIDVPFWTDPPELNDDKLILCERDTFPVMYADGDPCDLVNVLRNGWDHISAPRLALLCERYERLVFVHFPYGTLPLEHRDAVANNLGLHRISGPGVEEEAQDHFLAARNGDSERLWESTIEIFLKPVLFFPDFDQDGGVAVSVEATGYKQFSSRVIRFTRLFPFVLYPHRRGCVSHVKRLFADPTAGENAPYCKIGPFVIQTYDLLGVENITEINLELTHESPNRRPPIQYYPWLYPTGTFSI
jgi:hypothetical protein